MKEEQKEVGERAEGDKDKWKRMSGVVEKADLFFSCIAVEIRKGFSFLF